MAVRVLRLMEYTYPDLASAYEDMERWFVQNMQRFGEREIRSTVILNPTPYYEPFEKPGSFEEEQP